MRKVYVAVVVKYDEYGNVRPMNITWEDGRKYEIDKVTDIRRAVASKVGGTAIRYTVRINSKETFLFEDEGKWFVESRV